MITTISSSQAPSPAQHPAALAAGCSIRARLTPSLRSALCPLPSALCPLPSAHHSTTNRAIFLIGNGARSHK
ncbi:hypothetical protein C7N77_11835 [Aeromonas rivipollensis]|nr:hypothetical protein C7N77_11835 [Aeromonas rivipollensis]